MSPLWLIEHDDGVRRSWVGDVPQSDAEPLLAKLDAEWRDEDKAAGVKPGQVSMRSYTEAQRESLTLEVHRREAVVRGIDPDLIHTPVP